MSMRFGFKPTSARPVLWLGRLVVFLALEVHARAGERKPP
ncbi:hypothetical protein ACVILL_007729 [Bradyrhizobium sp. USDA 3364]